MNLNENDIVIVDRCEFQLKIFIDCVKSGSDNKHYPELVKKSIGIIKGTIKKHCYWCYNESDSAYKYYGNKGRTVSPELRYSKDKEKNREIIIKVLKTIGPKPISDKSYHLHVDWETSNEMTLDTIEWIESSENNRKKAGVHRFENGDTIPQLAKRMNMKSGTLSSRIRNGIELYAEIMPNYDKKIQGEKFEKIMKKIEQGLIYVDKNGKIFTEKKKLLIERETCKKGYTQTKLKGIGNISTHHIVLLYYAGPPPHDGRVWQGEHTNNKKNDNRPSNLCWMTHDKNIQKRDLQAHELSDFVNKCIGSGEAIPCFLNYRKTHPNIDDSSTETISYKNSISQNLQCYSHYKIGFIDIPDNLYELKKIANRYVKSGVMNSDLLLRLMISPSNKLTSNSVGEITITDKNGKDINIKSIHKNTRSSFHISYYSNEIINNLKDLINKKYYPELNKVIEKIPKNTILESKKPIEIRNIFRKKKQNTVPDIDDFDIRLIGKSYINGVPFKVPELSGKIVKFKNGNINPLLITYTSEDGPIEVLCSRCDNKLPKTTDAKTYYTMSSKTKEYGLLCSVCEQKSRVIRAKKSN